ncbi:hypothetical protein ACFFRR_010201 [Megaselia abdita]
MYRNKKLIYQPESKPYDAFLIEKKTPSIKSSSEPVPRKTFLKVGVLANVKGSAYIEYGNTKLIAAILPPREISKQVKKGSLAVINCEISYAQFASRNMSSVKERTLSSALKKALEPVICRQEYPNFQIDVNVFVIQDDGCVLSSAINCSAAALMQGHIGMFDLITASTVLFYNNQILVNPTIEEEELLASEENSGGDEQMGSLILASLGSFNQIAQFSQRGFLKLISISTLKSRRKFHII